MSYLIKDTTKQERIELIRSWVPDDEVMDGCDIDLWEIYKESGEVERYNVFKVIMVVRHAQDGKLYLYDLVNIKKETSNLFQP